MRTTFNKWFWIWELPKEEVWINEMAEHGYGLVHAGRITFEFEDIEPGQYKYREILFKGSWDSDKVREFLQFMEEMGIRNVAHVSYPNHTILYMRYEDNGTDPEIYSDLDSKIEYEKMLCSYLLPLAIINILAFVYNMCVFVSFLLNGRFSGINLLCFINLGIAIAVFIQISKKQSTIKKLQEERSIHE